MDIPLQKEKAQTLRSLHLAGPMLVLPNVWNPIGALILAKKGYPAIATASAAISSSLGYHDGERITRSTFIDIVGRIARSVDVPVTADMEAGYGESLSELQDTAQQVIESGIVGINIEDGLEGGGLRATEAQCQRIFALRQVAERLGVPLVVNARIDSYLSPSFKTSEEATEDAVARANAYSTAGADCIFPVGPADEATVRELRRRIGGPINILASPTAAPLSILRAIGINRVSFGPFIFRACLRKFADIAGDLATTDDYSCFAGMMPKAELSEYLLDGFE
ncbi:MAG TPA: isocitrate lyase/phosphoenolpyruvate mutase family protein [Paucimonas sp.]|nr:isocitrate lyase/phosphoenolpyruvate mutase family protein [Paucimonas sp.]HJW54615.1 isocitrate lyase/phosphoenolpyruvate mutase family protein [Burkholderiaceae bacterium]